MLVKGLVLDVCSHRCCPTLTFYSASSGSFLLIKLGPAYSKSVCSSRCVCMLISMRHFCFWSICTFVCVCLCLSHAFSYVHIFFMDVHVGRVFVSVVPIHRFPSGTGRCWIGTWKFPIHKMLECNNNCDRVMSWLEFWRVSWAAVDGRPSVGAAGGRAVIDTGSQNTVCTSVTQLR